MSVDGYKSAKYYKVETDHLKTKYLNATAGITTQRLTVLCIHEKHVLTVGVLPNSKRLCVCAIHDQCAIIHIQLIHRKMNVRGNFDVVGNFTYTGQNIFQQVDNICITASDNNGDSVDLGMLWKNSGGYTGLYRDYSDEEWHLILKAC